ncbi:hypothetical protein H6P81_011195 [Aristolochia fimbriata]|uniref:Pseudouridine synthase I TruA alpha/beta domain-containing protein n=1 Tax=Aristolochia fimbriata TaxID=158543 RepID=A0AAV7EQW4_ARIFI|nr:hypothetical protein H6P81_011195 [Aristolochia fimbriata]
MEGAPEENPMHRLQAQLQCLSKRVEELERENARLSSQVANCRCQQVDEKTSKDGNTSQPSGKDRSKSLCHPNIFGPLKGSQDGESTRSSDMEFTQKLSGCTRTMCGYASRYVALKIMYFGQRFYGFASEAQMDPTVESELFRALERTKLLVSGKNNICYSRCGRTDKGVSAIGQVISLFLRSNCKESIEDLNNNVADSVEKGFLPSIENEIDYVRVLNKVLPRDIRVLGWYPVSKDFHARFSCSSREYKYLFWMEGLDVSKMELAAQKFVGEHDFRNFCKMDAANVHNYKRKITYFTIKSCEERCNYYGNEVGAITIKGSAFLWHQVRCMVAVLFMIGQGLESPYVVDELLDIKRTPRKPQYPMAPELPLILQSCEFEGLKFVCSSEARQSLHEHLKNEFQTYMLQATIFLEALKSLSSPAAGGSPLHHAKSTRAHVPLVSRPTEPSYEERCVKLSNRDDRRKTGTSPKDHEAKRDET